MFSKTSVLRNKELDSDEFILQISQMVDIVVRKYVTRKAVPAREQEDMAMIVLEKFIRQKEKIMSAFQGKSSFNTYCIAILNRMVCEVIRKENRHWYSVVENDRSHPQETYSLDYETEKSLVLKNEIIRYERALLFFNNTTAKVTLFLKYYFGLTPTAEDYHRYGGIHSHQLRQILTAHQNMTKGDAFERMARAVNLVEGKDVKGDAIRMWLNKQMEILLARLNSSGGSLHTSESLGILCEMSAMNQLTTPN
ncbi:MAG: hypothetical protein WC341_12745 [Bacteroidales bacterium]|jgi:DNA-directed RNA polymerase specialized sigma24 family protein